MSVSKMVLANVAGTACIALGLFLGGCDSTESNPTKPAASGPIGTTDLTGSSDFDRELIAAKRGAANNAERLSAIEEVLSKYGFPHSAAPQAAAPQPGPVIPEAAAKTSGAAFAPIVRNFSAGNDIHTFHSQVDVGPFGTVTVTAVGSAGTDPFLVAYVRKGDGVYAYPITVVAYNDDISAANRNSTITWKNPGLGTWKVEIVAFNYYSYNHGTALVNITLNGAVTTYASRYLGGSALFNSDPIPAVPGNCFPGLTRATETHVSGGQHYPAAALVVDTKTKKGGIIWDNRDLGSQTLSFSPMLNNDYPSFALLFEAAASQSTAWNEEPSSYQFKQIDAYSCVN